MDYKSRIINERIVDGKTQYYRTLNNNREIITDVNGDVYLEVDKEVFEAELSDQEKQVIEYFYKGLGKITSMRDVILPHAIVRDDERVCFKTGIMDAEYKDGKLVWHGRPKHPSDGEFAQFMTLANEDYSNIYLENPYLSENDTP